MAARLAHLALHTVQDLLFHLPLRYQDRTRRVPIGSLRPGDEAVIQGEIRHSQLQPGRRRSLLALVTDGTGQIRLRLFHFSRTQQDALATGTRVLCFGEARRGSHGLEMVHPEYRILQSDARPSFDSHLTPTYPTTEGLGQASLRHAVAEALAVLKRAPPPELLPPEVLAHLQLPSLVEALHTVHRPSPAVPIHLLERGQHPARLRLAFEELLAHHLGLRILRRRMQSHAAPALHGDGSLSARLLAGLGFRLTDAQRRVWAEIGADLARSHPMRRLLQGDVGSGKTVVAALAALQTIEAGHQVAVMAPTEILAEQHLRSLSAWLEPLGLEVAWLSGRMSAGQHRAARDALDAGRVPLAVGTHALLQDDVRFARLGLVVMDEQHRFGVHQRLALRSKGLRDGHYPHQLIMTATPIPRTFAMSMVYADLDTSLLDESPPGRQPVDTVVIPDSRRDQVVARIRAACGQGRQAYWVCPLIEESEGVQAQAATDTAARLRQLLPEVPIGLVHGRMSAADKEDAMLRFKRADLGLLVATTVIEVGVDVPRASLMVIENAERLGLAQLHQLRGRVGRGAEKSTCVLMYRAPLSDTARQRLGVLRDTRDGFLIARRDMELRGWGEVLGTRQTGALRFRIADPMRDEHLFPAVQQAASALLSASPERVGPLLLRWTGDGVHYGHV